MKKLKKRKLQHLPTKNELVERRKELARVLEKIHSEHLTPNESTILQEMKEKYPDYSRMMLFNDRTQLNLDNNYIRFFLPNYSAYQEQINKMLQFVVQEAERNYNKEWKIKKTTVRTIVSGKNKKKIIEQTVESEMPHPKVAFLNILNKAAELMQEHSEGSNVHLGAIALQQELKNKDQEIAKLGNTLSEK